MLGAGPVRLEELTGLPLPFVDALKYFEAEMPDAALRGDESGTRISGDSGTECVMFSAVWEVEEVFLSLSAARASYIECQWRPYITHGPMNQVFARGRV